METLNLIANLNNFFSNLQNGRPLRVLLGYSGGLDSSVLLFLLDKLPANLITVVGIAHVNHNLREASTSDAQFASEIASRYKFPFYYLNVCPLRMDLTNEVWGREIRYLYFEELRIKHEVDYVLTAHHSDDELETFIFRLIMGRNNPSLSLIQEVDNVRKLLRPLLQIDKFDLLNIAMENKLEFIQDESNDDSKYARNYIRNEILPKFERINPSYRKAITKFIDFRRKDSALISKDPRLELDKIGINTLLNYDDPLALRGLIALVGRQIGDLSKTVSLRKYEDLLGMLRGGFEGEKFIDLGSGLTAILDLRQADLSVEVLPNKELEKRNKQISKHSSLELELKLNHTINFECPISSCKVYITLQDGIDSFTRDSQSIGNFAVENFGLDLNNNKVLIRGGYTGGFIRKEPKSRKRISRLLKESKFSKKERVSLIYISEGNDLIWIPKLARRNPELDEGLQTYSIKIDYDF